MMYCEKPGEETMSTTLSGEPCLPGELRCEDLTPANSEKKINNNNLVMIPLSLPSVPTCTSPEAFNVSVIVNVNTNNKETTSSSIQQPSIISDTEFGDGAYAQETTISVRHPNNYIPKSQIITYTTTTTTKTTRIERVGQGSNTNLSDVQTQEGEVGESTPTSPFAHSMNKNLKSPKDPASPKGRLSIASELSRNFSFLQFPAMDRITSRKNSIISTITTSSQKVQEKLESAVKGILKKAAKAQKKVQRVTWTAHVIQDMKDEEAINIKKAGSRSVNNNLQSDESIEEVDNDVDGQEADQRQRSVSLEIMRKLHSSARSQTKSTGIARWSEGLFKHKRSSEAQNKGRGSIGGPMPGVFDQVTCGSRKQIMCSMFGYPNDIVPDIEAMNQSTVFFIFVTICRYNLIFVLIPSAIIFPTMMSIDNTSDASFILIAIMICTIIIYRTCCSMLSELAIVSELMVHIIHYAIGIITLAIILIGLEFIIFPMYQWQKMRYDLLWAVAIHFILLDILKNIIEEVGWYRSSMARRMIGSANIPNMCIQIFDALLESIKSTIPTITMIMIVICIPAIIRYFIVLSLTTRIIILSGLTIGQILFNIICCTILSSNKLLIDITSSQEYFLMYHNVWTWIIRLLLLINQETELLLVGNGVYTCVQIGSSAALVLYRNSCLYSSLVYGEHNQKEHLRKRLSVTLQNFMMNILSGIAIMLFLLLSLQCFNNHSLFSLWSSWTNHLTTSQIRDITLINIVPFVLVQFIIIYRLRCYGLPLKPYISTFKWKSCFRYCIVVMLFLCTHIFSIMDRE